MTKQPTQYQSYLLRLWRSNAHSTWRSSLQCTASGEKQTFTDLAALYSFLLTQFADEALPLGEAPGAVEAPQKSVISPKATNPTYPFSAIINLTNDSEGDPK